MNNQTENLPKKNRSDLIGFMVAAILIATTVTVGVLIGFGILAAGWIFLAFVTGVIGVAVFGSTAASVY